MKKAIIIAAASVLSIAAAEARQAQSPAPSASIVADAALGRNYLPVKVSWSLPTGAARCELQDSLNGADYKPIALPSATAAEVSVNLVLGTAHKLRMQSYDSADKASGWAEAAPFKVAVARESDEALSWTGSWKRVLSPGAPRNWGAADSVIRITSQSDASVSYSFKGAVVAVLATRTSAGGLADVVIDGSKAGAIDLYADEPAFGSVVFAKNDLDPAAVHKIEVKPTGAGSVRSLGTEVNVYGFATLAP